MNKNFFNIRNNDNDDENKSGNDDRFLATPLYTTPNLEQNHIISSLLWDGWGPGIRAVGMHSILRSLTTAEASLPPFFLPGPPKALKKMAVLPR